MGIVAKIFEVNLGYYENHVYQSWEVAQSFKKTKQLVRIWRKMKKKKKLAEQFWSSDCQIQHWLLSLAFLYFPDSCNMDASYSSSKASQSIKESSIPIISLGTHSDSL